MLSGRTIVTLGMVGFGLYVLRKGVAVAESIPVHGLGADPTQPDAAKQAADAAAISAIQNMPLNIPVLQSVYPRLFQPSGA